MAINKAREINNIEIASIKKLLLNPEYLNDFKVLRRKEIKIIEKFSQEIEDEFGSESLMMLMKKDFIEFHSFDALILNDLKFIAGEKDYLTSAKIEKITHSAFQEIHSSIKPLLLDFCAKHNINIPLDPDYLKNQLDYDFKELFEQCFIDKWPNTALLPLIKILPVDPDQLYNTDNIDEDGYITLKIKTNSEYSKEIILYLLDKIIIDYTKLNNWKCFNKKFKNKSLLYEAKRRNSPTITKPAEPKVRFRDNILQALVVWEKWLSTFQCILTPAKSFKKIAVELKTNESTVKSQWYRAYMFIFGKKYTKNDIIYSPTPIGLCIDCPNLSQCDKLCFRADLELNKTPKNIRETTMDESHLDIANNKSHKK